jgi:hypothetical protein
MTLSANVEQKLKKDAIIKGLVLGVIVVALSIFSFYFITRLTQNPLFILIVIFLCATLLPVIISIFFALDMRRKIGGYWGVRQAITGIFLMFLISYAILTIGRDFIFAKLIEPNMAEKVKTVMIDVKQSRLVAQGAPADVVKSQIADLKKDLAAPVNLTVIDILNDYLKTIILLFAIAVVFAAVLKKENPAIENDIVIIEE